MGIGTTSFLFDLYPEHPAHSRCSVTSVGGRAEGKKMILLWPRNSPYPLGCHVDSPMLMRSSRASWFNEVVFFCGWDLLK